MFSRRTVRQQLVFFSFEFVWLCFALGINTFFSIHTRICTHKRCKWLTHLLKLENGVGGGGPGLLLLQQDAFCRTAIPCVWLCFCACLVPSMHKHAHMVQVAHCLNSEKVGVPMGCKCKSIRRCACLDQRWDEQMFWSSVEGAKE